MVLIGIDPYPYDFMDKLDDGWMHY
jgi:hypothetical protein